MLEERVRQSSLEIERLQQELLKTQEDLRRSENTVLAQLEIEAKMIEDKARLARQNSQLGTFVLRAHTRLRNFFEFLMGSQSCAGSCELCAVSCVL